MIRIDNGSPIINTQSDSTGVESIGIGCPSGEPTTTPGPPKSLNKNKIVILALLSIS
jgi:hypothetical protein